jgi:hypothetical protein
VQREDFEIIVTRYFKFQMRDLPVTKTLSLTRRSLVLLSSVLLCSAITAAQRVNSTPAPPPRTPDITADRNGQENPGPLTTFEEELRAKRAIKLAEKEHEDNLNRAREISQLGQDLKSEMKSRTSLDPGDTKKLDRLEKLTKKIRGEAGGEDDDVQIANAPADIPTAVTQIADNAEQLSKDVQKTPRQVVSAAVIDRANVLLQLVRILRGFIH